MMDLPAIKQEIDISETMVLDETAFEAFYKANYLPLCLYCRAKFKVNTQQAEDQVDAGFMRLWEKRYQLQPGRSPLSYLYTIINNQCLNAIKHEKVKRNHMLSVLHDAADCQLIPARENADLKQLEADVHSIISCMPPQMRSIFELSRFQDLKYAEIANTMGISVSTVETQMSRALLRLRKGLAPYLEILLPVLFIFLKK